MDIVFLMWLWIDGTKKKKKINQKIKMRYIRGEMTKDVPRS